MIDLSGVDLLGILPGEYRRFGLSSRSGVEFAGPCPVCGGEDRFRVWPEPPDGNPRFWCRQCDFRGDAIDFVRWADGVDFREAKRRLLGDLYTPSARPRAAVRAKAQNTHVSTPIVSESWLRIACGCSGRYLAWWQYRGIIADTVDTFRLGFARLPGADFMHMDKALILPVLDCRSKVVQLRARKVSGGWLTLGHGARLYRPLGIQAGRPLWIVENCANALLIIQYSGGEWSAIAPTTGAGTWPMYQDEHGQRAALWPRLVKEAGPAYVFIAGDDDEAGHKMNRNWSDALGRLGVPHECTVMTPEIEKGFMP